MIFPTLETELELLQTYEHVIGVDEVGRGAVAGPVSVGAARFSRGDSTHIPSGLADSKLLSESKRETVASQIPSWLVCNVASVEAVGIESAGISKALQQAAVEAISSLLLPGSVILLDGTHNFLRGVLDVPVVTKVKADRDCAVVSAAALMAKTSRDSHMRDLHLDFPLYDWVSNKGYASESHIAALQAAGPTQHHRISWLSKILGTEQLF